MWTRAGTCVVSYGAQLSHVKCMACCECCGWPQLSKEATVVTSLNLMNPHDGMQHAPKALEVPQQQGHPKQLISTHWQPVWCGVAWHKTHPPSAWCNMHHHATPSAANRVQGAQRLTSVKPRRWAASTYNMEAPGFYPHTRPAHTCVERPKPLIEGTFSHPSHQLRAWPRMTVTQPSGAHKPSTPHPSLAHPNRNAVLLAGVLVRHNTRPSLTC